MRRGAELINGQQLLFACCFERKKIKIQGRTCFDPNPCTNLSMARQAGMIIASCNGTATIRARTFSTVQFVRSSDPAIPMDEAGVTCKRVIVCGWPGSM